MNTNISDARDSHLDDYLFPTTHDQIMALKAIFYYDYFITIDREVKYMWRRPKKPSTYWFLVNRYFLFAGNIIMALFQFTTSNFLNVRGLSQQ
ncbi:hypothetical protein BD779DRAFT_1517984 [Infundibulicybe gibba]|nr:hypothetical protein BD779DRAFT_1517984 [Infundibulicybe gibba]